MGIDITAYRKIKRSGCIIEGGEPIDPQTGDYAENVVILWLNPDFPGRADEIESGAAYEYEETDHFLSRGYIGYGHLRNELAKLAGYPLGQDEHFGEMRDSYCVACWNGATGPFSELINFSDCEGVIGASVSLKLAKDFADFQAKADEHENGNFRSFYNSLRAAFEMASDGGAVKFH